jgi:hypothetical protein
MHQNAKISMFLELLYSCFILSFERGWEGISFYIAPTQHRTYSNVSALLVEEER